MAASIGHGFFSFYRPSLFFFFLPFSEKTWECERHVMGFSFSPYHVEIMPKKLLIGGWTRMGLRGDIRVSQNVNVDASTFPKLGIYIFLHVPPN